MYTDHFSIYPRLLNMTLIYNTYDKYACVYCDKKYNQHHIKSKMKNIKMATKLFPTHTHMYKKDGNLRSKMLQWLFFKCLSMINTIENSCSLTLEPNKKTNFHFW